MRAGDLLSPARVVCVRTMLYNSAVRGKVIANRKGGTASAAYTFELSGGSGAPGPAARELHGENARGDSRSMRGQPPSDRHGFYSRTLVDAAFDGVIHVRRNLCRSCKRTVSLLPESAISWLRFSVSVIAVTFGSAARIHADQLGPASSHRAAVGEHLRWLPLDHGPCIDKIKCQLVAHEAKPVAPAAVHGSPSIS